MKQIILKMCLFITILSVSFSEEYFVDNQNPISDNSNPGSKDLPFLTIQYAVSKANQSGDVVYVREGTYDERISCRNSGSKESGFINILGFPGDSKPVIRGFEILGVHYVRISGFEVTHNSTQYSHGFILVYGCSHVEVLDNYIHHIVGQAVRWYNHNNTYIIVRGNEVYLAACPSGSPGECKGNGWAVGFAGGNHNLIEYNIAHRVGDFINIANDSIIVRNNFLYDFRNSYWTDGPGDALHADMFQPCGASLFPSKYQIYESNFMGDNIETNSHILQMRTNNSDDHHIIFRGNVGYNHGSYAMQCGGVDNVYYYNNTIHEINTVNPGNSGIGYNSEGEDNALNNQNFNNIFSEFGNGTKPPIIIGASCTLASSNNVCYLAGTHSSCASPDNPMFKNTDSRDYYIQSGSSAIGIGKEITKIISPDGTGNTFEVENADLLTDGYGIAEGDIIKIGNNEPVRILNIDAKTITVNQNISWNSGDEIYWRNQDSMPDAGAFEYRPEGYDFDIEINSPTDGDYISGQVLITTTSVNPDCIRYIIFYIDGIPMAQDFDYPFEYSWIATDYPEASNHIIEARAYALFASKTLTKSDTIHVSITFTDVIDSSAPVDVFKVLSCPAKEMCIITINKYIKSINGEYKFKIFNINGICIEELNSNNHQFVWNTKSLPDGIYFVQLVGKNVLKTQKFVLIN
ncbi:MAG: Ig-like domain-containing protein [bacterium]